MPFVYKLCHFCISLPRSGSGASCVVSLAALKARATLELQKRRGGGREDDFSRTGTSDRSQQAPQGEADDEVSGYEETFNNDCSSGSGNDPISHQHRVASAYSDKEVREVLNFLELRGYVSFHGEGGEEGEVYGITDQAKDTNSQTDNSPAARLQQRNMYAQQNHSRNHALNAGATTPSNWNPKQGVAGPSVVEGML